MLIPTLTSNRRNPRSPPGPVQGAPPAQVPGDEQRLGQVAPDHLPWRRVSVLMVTSGYDHRVRICLDWRALARWRGERR
jgi:hypothetical protein